MAAVAASGGSAAQHPEAAVVRIFRTVLFWMLAAGLLAAHVLVIQHSMGARFWEDEAFNLTVPLNLLAGLGYSSDGALSGSVITPFDPRISTGPTVLLPVAGVLMFGGDPVISARLVPVLFWMLLIAGLAVLGGRLAGRWVALVGAAVPLAFNGFGSVSPIQGPADLLGEVPAAALLVWALIALRKRPWLAGLLVGLAVQAKLIALLALPAFAVAIWVRSPGRGWSRLVQTLKRGWMPLLLAGVPTLLFELAALMSMGVSGFAAHLRGMRDFVLGGGQHMEPTTVPQKLDALASAWFVPTWVAGLAVVLAAALIIGGFIEVRRRGRLKRQAFMLALSAAFGALAFVGWWSTAAHTPLWVRHPAAGVLAFLPVLVIVAMWGAQLLTSVGSTPFVGSQHAASSGMRAHNATPRDGDEGSDGGAPIAQEPFVGSQHAGSSRVRAHSATPRDGGGSSDGGASIAQAPLVGSQHAASSGMRAHNATPRDGGGGTYSDGHKRTRRIAGATFAVLLSASLAWSIAGHVQHTTVPRSETLATQRAEVAPIAEWVEQTGTEWLAARPWGAAVAPVVMSGAHVGLFDSPSMAEYPQLTGQQCETETLIESGRYRVCAAR